MKIFIVNRHKDDILGGSEIQCDLIARNLTNMGVDIIYIAMQSAHEFNLPYKVIPMQRYSVQEFKEIINQEMPDIIYWRYNKLNLRSALHTTHKYKIKFIFSLSNVNDISKWHWSWEPVISKPLYSIKQFFATVKKSVYSSWNHLAFRNIDGVVSLQGVFIPKLPKRFNEKNAICIHNSMEFRPSCDFRWERPYVVWVANLKALKRPEVYIRLSKVFENDGVDFLMIGKIQDPAYNYVNDLSQLPRNFHYLGLKPVHDVDAILQSSLMMIHTCKPEGFGNNFIQAWLAGKPTISLSFDPDHLIEEHQIGYISHTFEKLEEQTRFLINNDQQRLEMGKRAQNMANEMFDSKKNSMKLLLFMQNLM